MKTEEYPREYEFVFTGKEKLKRHLKEDKIDFLDGNPKSMTQYVEMAKSFMWDAEMQIFDIIVKAAWLKKRFIYRKAVPNITINNMGWEYNMAIATLFKAKIGFHPGMFSHNGSGWMKLLITYLPDFYPDFDMSNPFETKFEYPYKYMNLECLVLVYSMKDRLEFLKRGEERKMNYAEFLDYMLNHIQCHNEKTTENEYALRVGKNAINYISIKK